MKYDIKKGHHANLEGDGLREIMTEIFGDVIKEGETLVASYGGMSKISVKLLDKSSLWVETEKNLEIPNEMIAETIRKYNLFMERATGFNSKQRRNRLSKKAKEGKL